MGITHLAQNARIANWALILCILGHANLLSATKRFKGTHHPKMNHNIPFITWPIPCSLGQDFFFLKTKKKWYMASKIYVNDILRHVHIKVSAM